MVSPQDDRLHVGVVRRGRLIELQNGVFVELQSFQYKQGYPGFNVVDSLGESRWLSCQWLEQNFKAIA